MNHKPSLVYPTQNYPSLACRVSRPPIRTSACMLTNHFSLYPVPDGSSILEDILEGLNEVHEAEKPPQVNGVHKSKGKGRMVHDIDVDMEEDAASIPARQRTLAVHLSPAECPNLVSTMKAIVSGFVDRVIADEEEEEDDALRKF